MTATTTSTMTPPQSAAPAPALLSHLGELGDSGLLLGLMLVVLGVATGVAALLTALG